MSARKAKKRVRYGAKAITKSPPFPSDLDGRYIRANPLTEEAIISGYDAYCKSAKWPVKLP